MVVCPQGGKHVVPSWMVEFHLNHCRDSCCTDAKKTPPGSPRATEDWEAECQEASPLAMASAKPLFFQVASPGLTKGQRKKHYRELLGQYRDARALQARYDMLADDEQPVPSAEQHGDTVSTATVRSGSERFPEVGAASPHNAEPSDVESVPVIVAGPGFGGDDTVVKLVDEDGNTFYTTRGRGRRIPLNGGSRHVGQWRPEKSSCLLAFCEGDNIAQCMAR